MAYTKNYCKTTRKQIGEYKGYPIFKETTKYFHKCPFNGLYYDSSWVTDERTCFYVGTKYGNINHASDRYASCSYSEEEAKNLVERIENGEIVLTDKERHDWVLGPNAKNSWGFNTEMLLAIMRGYKKASPRRRMGYLERLEDANFHTEYGLLEEENYVEFEKVVRSL